MENRVEEIKTVGKKKVGQIRNKKNNTSKSDLVLYGITG